MVGDLTEETGGEGEVVGEEEMVEVEEEEEAAEEKGNSGEQELDDEKLPGKFCATKCISKRKLMLTMWCK